MKLIDQNGKRIMEECKKVARDAGLNFDDESLEYIVSNRDMLELQPKIMVPTLYDFWVHDVEVLQAKGVYEIRPSNPYETVINTRPAISLYNTDNPEWLNTMIFYHVLGHIDFFQNNNFFQNTWGDDFSGQALADKRLIASLRDEHGRWLDYVIEFARSIDNLVDFQGSIAKENVDEGTSAPKKIDFYFNHFLQNTDVTHSEYLDEVERYNNLKRIMGASAESLFFAEVKSEYPEFDSLFEKHSEKDSNPVDIMEFIMEESPFLNKKENEWMKGVIQIVRNTSLYFQPQIRTKIFNEGWATYWHHELFTRDKRLRGHEVDFAKIHTLVTSLPKVGLNPYAIGWRLVKHIKESGDRGLYSREYSQLTNIDDRKIFDQNTNNGKDLIFKLRGEMDDFNLINKFVNQDFCDRYNLFVTGKRPHEERDVWEYYVKSRNADDYKKLITSQLYHPPHVTFKAQRTGGLFIYHHFEGKQLNEKQIVNTLIGINYLWGGEVKLRTNRLVMDYETEQAEKVRYLYTAKNKNVTKKKLN